MAGGRPLKFESVEDMQKQMDAYFLECDTADPKEPYTITGLALALDTSRQTLVNYEKRDEYFDAIKRAKLKVENSYEKHLLKGQVAGAIFSLKNNFSWADQQQLDVKSENKHDVTYSSADINDRIAELAGIA